ncbi:ABC transporter ATP-binding protein [Pseudobacteriovorax antillogorgiicola]|uniref:ABC-2 type transport system ATP-binding protein n=1 Tax=Pseudobacteriovorax antillogorgiicola TaxID=1513793 RepID=A0A1Y6CHX6_9BACT|nr:ABC transporter ATP-binding protein [Pseudobacteriovorax antillogorgiicola]TCS48627.1 ABC-2 type transport system ATP-binding protein [Pseudobacteriovorax antillogorgiicola]SMF55395.1 ABC-2 type transport system ATP-binding protein [Pseudobacteriovorax antillogorgiicola]
MIEVNGICKFYGQKKAVENLSFKISDGEIVGLLGVNGAGKSTILKVLGCFLLPSVGEARIGGYSVTHDSEKVRQLIGYLPDRPPLYHEMTVEAYLSFVAKLKDAPGDQIASYVEDAIKQANLEDVYDRQLGQLSHGYQQRVGIAQAIVHKPKVLILDEPINGLDPIQIAEMRDLILSLKGKHTVILSSHILSEITKTCDRILVIDKGQLVAEGNEKELMGNMDGAMDIAIEVDRWDDGLGDKIMGIEGVQSVTDHRQEATTTLDIACNLDLRGQIAKCVVESGVQLLALQKKQAELESLFFKLINTESRR